MQFCFLIWCGKSNWEKYSLLKTNFRNSTRYPLTLQVNVSFSETGREFHCHIQTQPVDLHPSSSHWKNHFMVLLTSRLRDMQNQCLFLISKWNYIKSKKNSKREAVIFFWPNTGNEKKRVAYCTAVGQEGLAYTATPSLCFTCIIPSQLQHCLCTVL